MNIWSPVQICSTEIPNRIMSSSVGEGMALPDGTPTTRWLDWYRTLGRKGAIGLILTGETSVDSAARAHGGMAVLAEDGQIRTYRKMTATVKRDGSRFFMQLSHVGMLARKNFSEKGPKGPSALALPGLEPAEELTAEEIAGIAAMFGSAARRAREAGFDGIELHAAHGYLLSEFLSPFFNRRTDGYGGGPAGRARFPMEAVKAVKKEAGEDFPVLMKINAEDLVPGGLTLQDSLEQASLLEAAGVDAFEISSGFGYSFSSDAHKGPMRPVNPRTFSGALYHAEYAAAFRSRLRVPVICVGGIRTFEQAESVIGNGWGDIAALARPLIREPDLVLRWKNGIHDSSTCLSCNKCCQALRSSLGIHCSSPV